MKGRRDIFVKIENTSEIVKIMEEIREEEKDLRQLFAKYDELSTLENKASENWKDNLEEIFRRMENISL